METIKVAVRKRGKKSKRTIKKPSKARYWASRHLQQNKVKALMRNNGMTRKQAEEYWAVCRGNRRTPYTPQKTAITSGEQSTAYRKAVA